jgi:hypothetical protein
LKAEKRKDFYKGFLLDVDFEIVSKKYSQMKIMKKIGKIRIANLIVAVFVLSGIQLQAQNNSETDEEISFLAEESVDVPGTGVQLTPPQHFVLSQEFPGFIHPGSASTILITREEGTPFVFYQHKNVEQSFEEQGIEVIKVEEIKNNERKKGILYTLAFTSSRYQVYQVDIHYWNL